MLTEGLAGARVFVRPGVTDMRKQINGLSVLVEQELGLDPFEHAVFLFCNRQRRILKALYWDASGFCLWQKRLEGRARFPWPETGAQAAREIDAKRLEMLLAGIDFWRAHQRINAKKVS